ncbi:hypothetical protein BH23CHL8_BH23CHL8_10870 [soil metagenome]
MTESDSRQHDAPGEPLDQGRAPGPRQDRPAGGPPPSWTQSLTSTAPVPGPAGLFYADVPNRIIAYIIDVIVLAVIGFVVALVLGGIFGGIMTTTEGAIDGATSDLNLFAFIVVAIGNLAISFAYFGYSWTTLRATPGMKLLGLQIGDERDGRSIDWNQALTRWLVLGIPSILASFASYVSSGLGFILSLVGLIWLIVLLYSIAKSPTKQGIHDRYARTIMVKAGRRLA